MNENWEWEWEWKWKIAIQIMFDIPNFSFKTICADINIKYNMSNIFENINKKISYVQI